MVAIRGIHISPYKVSGSITLLLMTMRAGSKYTWSEHWLFPLTEFFTMPIVAFVLFTIAAIIITYPHLRGVKALILSPLIVAFIGFFVYSYYI